MPLLVIFIGRYLIYLLVALPVIGLFFPVWRKLSVRALFSASISATTGWLIKDYFYLPRPFITGSSWPLLPYILDGSLPSVHTAVAVAISISIFYAHRRLGLVFICLAILVAVGRILGGVHTYFDVLVGFLIGLISVFITGKLSNWSTDKLSQRG